LAITSIEWNDVRKVEGEVIARVSIDGVDLAHEDPNINSTKVRCEEEGSRIGRNSEDQHLQRMRVSGGEPEGEFVVMVDLNLRMISMIRSRLGRMNCRSTLCISG